MHGLQPSGEMTIEWRRRALHITWLPVASMGRLASCAPLTDEEEEVLAALLAGAKVCMSREALEYKRYRKTASRKYIPACRLGGGGTGGDGDLCYSDEWKVRSGPPKNRLR